MYYEFSRHTDVPQEIRMLDFNSRWQQIMTVLENATKRDADQLEVPFVNGVGSFTNNGHVNLMILSASDPDQVRKIVQEIIKSQHADKVR